MRLEPSGMSFLLYEMGERPSFTVCLSPNSLDCPICRALFEDPVQMTCGHTICRRCHSQLTRVNRRAESVSCPVCRSPSKHENRLPVNYILKDIVEQYRRQQQNEWTSDDVRFACSNCADDMKLDKALLCKTCSTFTVLQKDIICGHCGFTHHPAHNLVAVEFATQESRHRAKKSICDKKKAAVQAILSLTEAVEDLHNRLSCAVHKLTSELSEFSLAEASTNEVFLPQQNLEEIELEMHKKAEEIKKEAIDAHERISKFR